MSNCIKHLKYLILLLNTHTHTHTHTYKIVKSFPACQCYSGFLIWTVLVSLWLLWLKHTHGHRFTFTVITIQINVLMGDDIVIVLHKLNQGNVERVNQQMFVFIW